MDNNTKDNILNGVRSALIAFLVSIAISLVVSIIFNYSIFEKFNELMSGNLGLDKGANISSIIKITGIIFNFSLFNTVSQVRFGALIFIFIPVISFCISNRYIDKKRKIELSDIGVYLLSSGIFAMFQFIISLATKGELVEGININFATLGNFVTTVIFTFIIQLFIKFNYRVDTNNGGIKAFKYTYRIMGVIGTVIGIGIIIYGLKDYSKDVVKFIIAAILMLPNVIAYVYFYMIGLSMSFNEELQSAINNFINVDLTLQKIIYVRYIAIIVFLLIIVYIIFKMDKKNLIKNALIYSISFSVFIGTLAYCSSINLINVKGMFSIRFSVSSFFLSWLIPLLAIWIVVLLYYLIAKVKEIINTP
jgi:hypothetical protein